MPSPNVAEDHQTKNATALTDIDAAILVPDADAKDVLVDEALKLIFDLQRCETLSQNITTLAKPNATEEIVDEIEKLISA